MKTILTCALAATTLAGALGLAGEASAQRWHGDRGGYGDRGDRGWRGHDRDDGAAIALGLLAGAALAGQPGYAYYRSPGYYPSYYRPYYRRCWIESRWDPYYGRVHYRVCR